jgi:hypothetical protein
VTDAASCPLDWRLFLPESWDDTSTADPEQVSAIAARRAKCAIPDDQRHRRKWELALEMIDELTEWGRTRRSWSPTPATASPHCFAKG